MNRRALILAGVILAIVVTPVSGGIKVEQVDEWEPWWEVKDSARYRIVNKRHHRFIGSWAGHEKKMRKQAATLCLVMGYRWIRVIDQGGDTIDVACFNLSEKVSPWTAGGGDCEALSPDWMRSPPPRWLEKFKAEQLKAKRLKAEQKQD